MLARLLPIALAIAGLAGLFVSVQMRAAADGPTSQAASTYKMVVPGIASDGAAPPPNPPTPTPEPPVYQGAVSAIYLANAHLSGQYVVEQRGTYIDNTGRERFQDPTGPARIAWYKEFGQPGTRATNSMFAAHVDYVNYGAAPFWYLTSTQVGDSLAIVMDNGIEYDYTVQSVKIINLADLDMNAIVFPPLDSNRERVTFISCGGTFTPYPGGGGEYDSRVVMYAERVIQ